MGAKFAATDEAAGTARTGQLTVANKDGDTSYQAKGSLKDALSDDVTLTASMQFDYADGQVDVKNAAQLDVNLPTSFGVDSATIGEFMDSKKGTGFTVSVDEKFSDDFSGSAGVGVFDNGENVGSSIASAGIEYSVSADTSLYANVSNFEQENVDTATGGQLGVKTKINDGLNLNIGGYVGEYTEFKDAAAPKPHEESVFANLEWKF